MPKIKKYVIACDIRLTAPLHISSIDKGAYNASRQVLQRRPTTLPGFVATSLTRTAEMLEFAKLRKVRSAGQNAVGSDAGETEPTEQAEWNRFEVPIVPIIPSSTLGGKLRRMAAEMLMDSLAEREVHLSVDAYNTLTSGSASTEIVSASMEGMRAARFDPFLGNFGGTALMVSAGTVISEGWPILAMTQSRHMTPPIAFDAPLAFDNINDMTSVVQIVRKDDARSLRDLDRLDKVVGLDHVGAYIERLDAVSVVSKTNKASGVKGTKSDIRTLNGMEVVNSGMPFALRVAVKATTPAHLGMMILAMQRFMVQGQVGGKAARGMGQFACSHSRLMEIDPATGCTINVTGLFEDRTVGYKVIDDSMIHKAVADATDYIDTCDSELFEAFADGNDAAIRARTQVPAPKAKVGTPASAVHAA